MHILEAHGPGAAVIFTLVDFRVRVTELNSNVPLQLILKSDSLRKDTKFLSTFH